jgi:hypothetical protein
MTPLDGGMDLTPAGFFIRYRPGWGFRRKLEKPGSRGDNPTVRADHHSRLCESHRFAATAYIGGHPLSPAGVASPAYLPARRLGYPGRAPGAGREICSTCYTGSRVVRFGTPIPGQPRAPAGWYRPGLAYELLQPLGKVSDLL